MQSKKILLMNKSTLEKISNEIPQDTKNMFKLIQFATTLMKNIEIKIDDNLEDNFVKIEEGENKDAE